MKELTKGEHIFKKEMADSAVLLGEMCIGKGAYFSQGTTIRSMGDYIKVGNDSYLLENSVAIGTEVFPILVGSKTVFGHRCTLIGAEVGDLCEIGNNCIILEGASLGNMCMLGEGTIIPPGMHVPDGSVVVGRPGRVIRKLSEEDLERLKRMRGNDLSIDPYEEKKLKNENREARQMGKLYKLNNHYPEISDSTLLLDSAEVTGNVIIGENTIIGAGVKIIGNTEHPIRIGNNVQILENTVLHLLADNELIIDDDVVIGPACMIHGCRIGKSTVIEAGVIVCDYSTVGENTLIKAGSLIKQRSEFPDDVVLEGFPAKIQQHVDNEIDGPTWRFDYEEIKKLIET